MAAEQLTPQATALLDAIRKRGVTSSSIRDAAHEACHALEWGVKKPWTRDNIHAKKPKAHRIFGPAPGIRSEVLARAVEQLVCGSLGVDCGPVEHWAAVCWMEMFKNERISLPEGDWLESRIRSAIGNPKSRAMADRVLALAGERG
jgi:hypothetical protein